MREKSHPSGRPIAKNTAVIAQKLASTARQASKRLPAFCCSRIVAPHRLIVGSGKAKRTKPNGSDRESTPTTTTSIGNVAANHCGRRGPMAAPSPMPRKAAINTRFEK